MWRFNIYSLQLPPEPWPLLWPPQCKPASTTSVICMALGHTGVCDPGTSRYKGKLANCFWFLNDCPQEEDDSTMHDTMSYVLPLQTHCWTGLCIFPYVCVHLIWTHYSLPIQMPLYNVSNASIWAFCLFYFYIKEKKDVRTSLTKNSFQSFHISLLLVRAKFTADIAIISRIYFIKPPFPPPHILIFFYNRSKW